MSSVFSNFIVYADESGDHGLDNIDPTFPAFALAFCLIDKRTYTKSIVPSFQSFKFDFWGHDSIVLHEHEIRKSKGPFSILMTDKELRENFYSRLNDLICDAPMEIIASVILKDRLKERYNTPSNPYEVALLFCMERLLARLREQQQEGRIVHVVFESRGHREDTALELEFRRICANQRNWGYRKPDFSAVQFEPIFVAKSANSTGLQLADLTARPIALHYLRPEQPNRAFEIIEPKLVGRKRFP